MDNPLNPFQMNPSFNNKNKQKECPRPIAIFVKDEIKMTGEEGEKKRKSSETQYFTFGLGDLFCALMGKKSAFCPTTMFGA